MTLKDPLGREAEPTRTAKRLKEKSLLKEEWGPSRMAIELLKWRSKVENMECEWESDKARFTSM